MDQEFTLEDLKQAETQLKELLKKKQQMLKNLDTIENSLYNLETSYIEESNYGNILKGYEAFLSSRTPSRRHRPMDSDRIFSRSSITFQKQEETAYGIIIINL
jgi:hypothetical protein